MITIFKIILLSTLLSGTDLLTNRWFQINPKAISHPVQIKLKNDLTNNLYRNYVVAAGRRSFKTERFAKRFLIKQCLNPNNTNKFFYAGAPTLSQSREIFWNDLKQLAPQWAVKKTSEVSMKIEFIGGNVLRVVGLKEFKRIQGQLMHGIVITEYQDCEEGVYSESIQPMINDTQGWCIKEGRPFGKNHFHTDYMKGIDGVQGWQSYHWTAEDILTEEQINEAKSDLAIQDYNREYLASFETGSSNPYYSYKPENNKPYQINKGLPLIITCDFNATEKPMSWVLGQKYNEHGKDITHWFKVFSFQFTNTETMCGIVKEYLADWKPIQIKFYGDYAGTQEKSNSSYTDWELIEKHFTNYSKFVINKKPCKSIRNSIGATNAQLFNAMNERRQFVDYENCKPLVLDWEKCEWKDNSRELKDNDNLRGHCCRAVDYYNDYEYPVKGQIISFQQ